METLTALLATLVAIWFITSVALYAHANTQDKTHAHELSKANTTTLELLEAFNTVTAERDSLRAMLYKSNAMTERVMRQRDSLRIAFNAKHFALEELLEEQNAHAYD